MGRELCEVSRKKADQQQPLHDWPLLIEWRQGSSGFHHRHEVRTSAPRQPVFLRWRRYSTEYILLHPCLAWPALKIGVLCTHSPRVHTDRDVAAG